jgi:hypothetical protein
MEVDDESVPTGQLAVAPTEGDSSSHRRNERNAQVLVSRLQMQRLQSRRALTSTARRGTSRTV